MRSRSSQRRRNMISQFGSAASSKRSSSAAAADHSPRRSTFPHAPRQPTKIEEHAGDGGIIIQCHFRRHWWSRVMRLYCFRFRIGLWKGRGSELMFAEAREPGLLPVLFQALYVP